VAVAVGVLEGVSAGGVSDGEGVDEGVKVWLGVSVAVNAGVWEINGGFKVMDGGI
jgi:hypothetical protein